MKQIATLCAILGLLPGAICAQAASSGLSLVKQDQGWQFLEDGQPVMFYQTVPKDLDGKYARADYVHPLMGLDGQVLTEDFPEDHFHHRGIFWTWHQLLVKGQSMGDAWICQDFIWDVHDVRVLDQGKDTAALGDNNTVAILIHGSTGQGGIIMLGQGALSAEAGKNAE